MLSAIRHCVDVFRAVSGFFGGFGNLVFYKIASCYHVLIQDQDGSHIKGLLINFIHHNWPSLLKHGFLEEFITPIVKVWVLLLRFYGLLTAQQKCWFCSFVFSKASKNKQELSFYSIPEFDEWKKHMENHKAWKIKYYKGLFKNKHVNPMNKW